MFLSVYNHLTTSFFVGMYPYSFLTIKMDLKPWFDVFIDEVPALEDEEFASKVEILYADLPVFAKYRHKLTSLKWGHTAWNGMKRINTIKKQALSPEECTKPLPTDESV